jgi:hypothetical protein
MYTEDSFNIEFVITGKTDGRWVVQAFDRNRKKIGSPIKCDTPSEAWVIYMMLNGYSYREPIELLEKTEAA